jgi:signal transduction histidine kinase
METSGPVIAREAVGPLRTLLLRRDSRRPAPRGPFFVYAVPLGLLALAGLGVVAGNYLAENRPGLAWMIAPLAVGSVLPVALVFYRPLLAWRLALLMIFLGPLAATAREPWPWNPVQIIGFLVVHAVLAVTTASGVTAWATALSIVGIFTYAEQANAWGAAVLVVAIAAVGDIVYRRRQARHQLAEQAELTELERARRAVLEERARIAREMHDVVAHHMSMIAVQAETAPYRVPGLPDPARTELATIATSARAALADMRKLLGVLRAESEDAPREPQPGLADLPALIGTAQRAGVTVSFTGDDLAEVPEAVGLAAYRIVQEALANAARHAPGGPVEVGARARDGRLELTVRNGPPRPRPVPAGGGGHGLTGMRERAELLGGTFRAGPDGRGGYLVEAVLPYAADTEEATG